MYDSSGNVLDSEFTFSTIQIVHPYTKTPFEITIIGNVEMISTYEIQSSVSQTTSLPQKLELSPVRIFEDEYSYHHVVGEVFNTGEITAHFVKIVISFYNNEGEIVGVGWTYTTLESIYPNGKSPFEITISDFVSNNGYSFQKLYTSYSLFVDSQEYGLIYDYPAHAEKIQKNNGINKTFEEEIPKETSGGGYLIATAAYGTELAPQIQFLREIRDNTVMSTVSGSSFMTEFNHLYYSFSPVIADWERENPMLQEAVKAFITPMLSSLSIMTLAEEGSESQVLGLGLSVIALNLGMYVAASAFVGFRISKYFKSRNS